MTFVEDDITTSSLERGSFDAIVRFEVLEHLANPLDGVAAMARLLRPGGVLYHDYNPFFAVNSPLNFVNDKRRTLALLEAGRIRHTSLTSEIEHMACHGDVVVVMGRDRVTDPPDGTITHRRFTNLWRLDGGRWRCFARHANVVAREPAD